MTNISSILPHPFKPVKNFFEVATGNEQIELKPEWRRVFAPADRASRKEAA